MREINWNTACTDTASWYPVAKSTMSNKYRYTRTLLSNSPMRSVRVISFEGNFYQWKWLQQGFWMAGLGITTQVTCHRAVASRLENHFPVKLSLWSSARLLAPLREAGQWQVTTLLLMGAGSRGSLPGTPPLLRAGHSSLPRAATGPWRPVAGGPEKMAVCCPPTGSPNISRNASTLSLCVIFSREMMRDEISGRSAGSCCAFTAGQIAGGPPQQLTHVVHYSPRLLLVCVHLLHQA